jgi:phenylalanyl-tRNA synthetase alpha chain
MTATDISFEGLLQEALQGLDDAGDEAGIEAWRVAWLGRQDGRVTALTRAIGDQPADQRKAFGAAANNLKKQLEAALDARTEALRRMQIEQLSRGSAIDVTLPGRPQPVGRLHPITQTMRDCIQAFDELGFRVFEVQEV